MTKEKNELIFKENDLRTKLIAHNGARLISQGGFNLIYIDNIFNTRIEEELKEYYITQSKLYLLNNTQKSQRKM